MYSTSIQTETRAMSVKDRIGVGFILATLIVWGALLAMPGEAHAGDSVFTPPDVTYVKPDADAAEMARNAMHADTADWATNAGRANSATNAANVQYAQTAGSAGYATSAGSTSYATRAHKADSASTANRASYASSAGSTSYASSSGHASTANSANYATRAGTASSAGNGVSHVESAPAGCDWNETGHATVYYVRLANGGRKQLFVDTSNCHFNGGS